MDSFLFFLHPEYNRFAIITHSRNFAYFTLGWLFCLTDVQPYSLSRSRNPPPPPPRPLLIAVGVISNENKCNNFTNVSTRFNQFDTIVSFGTSVPHL